MTPTHLEHLNPQTAQTTSLLNILWIFPSAAFPSWCGLKLVMSDHKQPWIMTKRNTTSVSIYSISDLGVSSNLIGSLSRSNWALFTPYGVDNAWSKQKQNGPCKLAFRHHQWSGNIENPKRCCIRKHKEGHKKCCWDHLVSIYYILYTIYYTILRGSANILPLFTSISKNNC